MLVEGSASSPCAVHAEPALRVVCARCPRVCSLQDGSTPLMLAAGWSESPDVVRALLEGKAELEAKDEARDFANACSGT